MCTANAHPADRYPTGMVLIQPDRGPSAWDRAMHSAQRAFWKRLKSGLQHVWPGPGHIPQATSLTGAHPSADCQRGS
jgi:hypothetical protein